MHPPQPFGVTYIIAYDVVSAPHGFTSQILENSSSWVFSMSISFKTAFNKFSAVSFDIGA
jgi:hypothetical protein